ncbi:ATP-binding protein [Streptomyces sp. CRN 30]|uniref:ATP-binding protein n=1 Tax=Streptomyces sp. CRN 30 TaxID=3075613 RepID=UPI002A7F812A|nr:ATP-binding protein [Streptomyces sp. CRN 30]
MSVPAPSSQHRSVNASRAVPVVPAAVLVVAAAAAGAALAMAPRGARTWTLAAVAVAWLCLACTVVVSTVLIRRARRTSLRQGDDVTQARAQAAQTAAESAHLVSVTLPAVAKRLRDGTGASEALAHATQPSDPQLRQVVQTFAGQIEDVVRHAAAGEAERRRAAEELDRTSTELRRLAEELLPVAVTRLREGTSADTVLAELDWPRDAAVRAPAESFVRELAHSERRAAAAQAASAKALSRVQAKAVSMLADLREMQDRHGEEVFGDLLRLDHSTSQLGLMTDRLALLMGGRSSRAWNKPIVMESILRGAVGRIAAYQRVRLHCSTGAAVTGFAAEGVMHLLAELMDNAANFSPPIDEVNVYVEERSAGIVVTIEDSGLKMAAAAMRRAEESVTGRTTDLASLQGTRLGLAVVGRLAVKYGISVNYRPSSRGGTGVVVLLPRQLLAQQREPAPARTPRRTAAPAATPEPAATPAEPAAPTASTASAPARPAATSPGSAPAVEEPAAVTPPPATPRVAVPGQAAAPRTPVDNTPNGLPVRSPGRTMAEADREREERRSKDATGTDTTAPDRSAVRDAGSRFGAFHRARQSGRDTTGPDSRTEPEPPAAP